MSKQPSDETVYPMLGMPDQVSDQVLPLHVQMSLDLRGQVARLPDYVSTQMPDQATLPPGHAPDEGLARANACVS